MLGHADDDDRKRLALLADAVREALIATLDGRADLARMLDDSRCELERLLMEATFAGGDYGRAVRRASLLLGVWRATPAVGHRCS